MAIRRVGERLPALDWVKRICAIDRGQLGAASDFFDQTAEFVDIFEAAVHRSEADVGDFVE